MQLLDLRSYLPKNLTSYVNAPLVHENVAELIHRYDIRRFCPEVSGSKQWVKERSHEAYAKNYSMVFTHDEPLAGRNMKKVGIKSTIFIDYLKRLELP